MMNPKTYTGTIMERTDGTFTVSVTSSWCDDGENFQEGIERFPGYHKGIEEPVRDTFLSFESAKAALLVEYPRMVFTNDYAPEQPNEWGVLKYTHFLQKTTEVSLK